VTSGWETALYFFDFRFHYATSLSNSIVIIPFVQAACSTSRRITWRTASRPKITTKTCSSSSPQRRIACSTSSSCTCWKIFTKAKATSVGTSPEMPETRAFSRQLVAYIAAFLPAAPYFKSNDARISAVCDDQYSSTLAILEETADEAFKVYMTRKTQGWFRRWGCPKRPPPPVPAPPLAARGAAQGRRRQGVPRHRQRRTTRMVQTSSQGGAGGEQASSPSWT
jgi:hypothetical protein